MNAPRPQGDPARRYFVAAEVTAAWLRQDRKCADCGRDIPRDLIEGDHVVPFSDGGRTALDNLQALCVACNRRKGNRPIVLPPPAPPHASVATAALWEWQLRALEVIESTREPVIIEACPG
jgi:hypothetical protein